MNEFVFTSMQRVFVRFVEEIEDSKKAFRNYLTFKSNMHVLLVSPSICFYFLWLSQCHFLSKTFIIEWADKIKVENWYFLGPRVPFNSVGGALISQNKKLMLINGHMKIDLKCRGNACFWTPGYNLKHSRYYPVAMVVPKSITNCTSLSNF